MTIPFDQLLPPPFIPDATPGASTPTPTATPPVTIPFDQLLPPPFIPNATPASPTPTPTPPPTIPSGPPTLPPFVPGATATPTPTPPPTSRPSASLQEAQALARRAVVELKAGGNTWTGVAFNAQGEIITTSQDLGNAPLAEFRFADGTTGQAWAHGRNDIVGLALLRPVGAARTYPFLPFASSPPAVNTAYGLVQYSGVAGAAPDLLDTAIIGARPALGGCSWLQSSWLQIRASGSATANGAVMFTTSGEIQGIRMPSLFLLNSNVGNPGEVFACTAADIRTTIPLLRAGQSIINAPRDSCDVGTIPPFPIIYHGNLSVNGQAAPEDTRVYARLRATGRPDIWKSVRTNAAGQYTFPIAVCVSGYNGATIEFWSNAKKASATSDYNPTGGGARVELNLAF